MKSSLPSLVLLADDVTGSQSTRYTAVGSREGEGQIEAYKKLPVSVITATNKPALLQLAVI